MTSPLEAFWDFVRFPRDARPRNALRARRSERHHGSHRRIRGGHELADLGIPTMLMTGRLDQTTPQETSAEPAWAGVDDPDDLWVETPLGAHFSFITICYDLDPGILALFQPDAGEDGCGPQFIDTEEAVSVLSAYVLAFGRRHVLGETEWDAVLTGPPLGNEATSDPP